MYEICVATCDDWEDGHDLFPDKQFNMAGDRWVICFGSCTLVTLFPKTISLLIINDFKQNNISKETGIAYYTAIKLARNLWT